MFPRHFFAGRLFAPRYFPQGDAVAAAPTFRLGVSQVAKGTTLVVPLFGTGTAWVSGTVFTVSSGTKNSQSVADGTDASLNYTAPGSAGTVTVTDTSTGLTATIAVVEPLKRRPKWFRGLT